MKFIEYVSNISLAFFVLAFLVKIIYENIVIVSTSLFCLPFILIFILLYLVYFKKNCFTGFLTGYYCNVFKNNNQKTTR